jgi:hypothetical protein
MCRKAYVGGMTLAAETARSGLDPLELRDSRIGSSLRRIGLTCLTLRRLDRRGSATMRCARLEWVHPDP